MLLSDSGLYGLGFAAESTIAAHAYAMIGGCGPNVHPHEMRQHSPSEHSQERRWSGITGSKH
jgi:hypothetical protein